MRVGSLGMNMDRRPPGILSISCALTDCDQLGENVGFRFDMVAGRRVGTRCYGFVDLSRKSTSVLTVQVGTGISDGRRTIRISRSARILRGDVSRRP